MRIEASPGIASKSGLSERNTYAVVTAIQALESGRRLRSLLLLDQDPFADKVGAAHIADPLEEQGIAVADRIVAAIHGVAAREGDELSRPVGGGAVRQLQVAAALRERIRHIECTASHRVAREQCDQSPVVHRGCRDADGSHHPSIVDDLECDRV